MKIAQVPPLFEAVPPRLYGGTEQVVANLCDALCEMGHDVVLFSAADARTKARLVPVRERALRLDPNPLKSAQAAHLNMLDEVRQAASYFDILHFHTELLHFPMFQDFAARSVTTLHNRLDIDDLRASLARWPEYGLVSISDSQRAPVREANWLATVHHGIATKAYEPPRSPSGDYLAFLGRIAPEKGPELAIHLAVKTGLPLKIAAKVDAADVQYFEQKVKPLLENPLIEFVGEIGDAQKSEFLGHARALLFPIQWPEPFGLVMIESMACGTPVVAWNCGSVPEVIEDGVTGFIVNTEQQALGAIARAPTLDRMRIRHEFEARFAAPIMANRYVKIYQRLLTAERAGRRPVGQWTG